MNYFDDESRILDFFRDIDISSIAFNRLTSDAINALNSILDPDCWIHWVYNARKSDPPPDYYNQKLHLMMEVMRIDDHAHINQQNILVNPVNELESKWQSRIRKMINEAGANQAEIGPVFVNATTTLPTHEDHNYSYYFQNFKRVIEKHVKKIPLYRRNHPDKKLIFFVMDESSAYFETTKCHKNFCGIEGQCIEGLPVFPFLDKQFIDILRNCDIDYVIWYMPWKLYLNHPQLHPHACIFDMRNLDESLIQEYRAQYIYSAEE